MDLDPIRLAIILGSTREGRFGPTVATWFATQARRRPDVSVDVIDLLEVDLPVRLGADPSPSAVGFVDRVDAADAFVVVTPEYNHGYPAALKQAIDLPREQWYRKPVGFVSYGGMAGGQRAVEQLRQVFAEVQAATVRDTVSFNLFLGPFDEHGVLREPEGPEEAGTTMLDELVWWGRALRTARGAESSAAA